MQTTQSITEQASTMNILGVVAEDTDHLREQYAYSLRNHGPWATESVLLAEKINSAEAHYNLVRTEAGLLDRPTLDVL